MRAALQDCINLTKLSVPNLTRIPSSFANNCPIEEFVYSADITEIGESAFYKSFAVDSNISLVLSKLEVLGNYAFRGSKIKGFSAEKVKTIGSYSLFGCAQLVDVQLPQVTNLGNYAFCESGVVNVQLPAVKDISYSCFTDCKSLVSVHLPNVETIQGSAFRRCSELKNAELPNLETIGEFAFEDCVNFELEEPLENLQTIPIAAFRNCNKIKKLIAPKLTSIGNHGLLIQNGLSASLSEVYCPNLTEIGSACFMNQTELTTVNAKLQKIGLQGFYRCLNLSSIDLSNAVEIGGFAFENTALSGELILNQLTTLGDEAFASTNITRIVAPKVSAVGNWVFVSCPFLEEVDLGGYVDDSGISYPQSLGGTGNTFSGNTNLKRIIVRSLVPPETTSNFFGSVASTVELYVPDASIDLYKRASNWSNKASMIYPISELNT